MENFKRKRGPGRGGVEERAEAGAAWDPMAQQEAEAIAKQQAQEAIEAATNKGKVEGVERDQNDDEDPNAPQLVR